MLADRSTRLSQHVAVKGIGRTSPNKTAQINKMASMKLEDHVTMEGLHTLSPSDLEVLDIFNFSASSQEPEPTIGLTQSIPPTLQNPQQMSLDQELIDATMAVLKTGKMTPLVKEELKCTIQNRRLARGEGELRVDFSPRPPCILSPEEVANIDARTLARRERNRIAALKCRHKKRLDQERQRELCEELQTKNKSLRFQVEQLELEKTAILKVLTDVHGICLHGGISPRWMGGTDGLHADQVGVAEMNCQPSSAEQSPMGYSDSSMDGIASPSGYTCYSP